MKLGEKQQRIFSQKYHFFIPSDPEGGRRFIAQDIHIRPDPEGGQMFIESQIPVKTRPRWRSHVY
jgi:hypothetical protein